MRRMRKNWPLVILLVLILVSMALYFKNRDQMIAEFVATENQEIRMRAHHEGTEWGYLRASIDYRMESFSVVLPVEEVPKATAYANRWDRSFTIKDHQTDPGLKVISFAGR